MANLLRVHEVAEIIGVHPQTLRRWMKQGHIRYVELPHGERRIDVAEIERLLLEGARPMEASA